MATSPAPFRVVTPEEVVQALGQDVQLVNVAGARLGGALDRAVTRVEGMLDTSLSAQTVEDSFFLPHRSVVGVKDFLVRLRLSNGLVRRDQPVVVSVSSERTGAYTDVSPADVMVDYNKGFVQVAVPANRCGATRLRHNHGSEYFKVTYASGYATNDTVPPPIKNAVICFTPKMIINVADVQDRRMAAAETAKVTALDTEGENQLNEFFRRIGNVLKPYFTTATVYGG